MESARRKQATGAGQEGGRGGGGGGEEGGIPITPQQQAERDDGGSPVDAVPSPSNGAPVVSPARDPTARKSEGATANSGVMSSGVTSPVEKQNTEQTKENKEEEEEEKEEEEKEEEEEEEEKDSSRQQRPSQQGPRQHPPQDHRLPQSPSPPSTQQPPRPPSPTPLSQNVEEADVLESLRRRTEHPEDAAGGDSEAENIGSVSDEENPDPNRDREREHQRGQDLESQLYADDNRSESTAYRETASFATRRSHMYKTSLAETDELLLSLEDGHSIISDIFEEAAGSLWLGGGRLLLGTKTGGVAPHSPRYLSASEKPRFSSKAYSRGRLGPSGAGASTPAASSLGVRGSSATSKDCSYRHQPASLSVMSSFVVDTPVGYYLDEEETKVGVVLVVLCCVVLCCVVLCCVVLCCVVCVCVCVCCVVVLCCAVLCCVCVCVCVCSLCVCVSVVSACVCVCVLSLIHI